MHKLIIIPLELNACMFSAQNTRITQKKEIFGKPNDLGISKIGKTWFRNEKCKMNFDFTKINISVQNRSSNTTSFFKKKAI